MESVMLTLSNRRAHLAATLGILLLGAFDSSHAAPASKSSHATHSADGGRHVFVLQVDHSGKEVTYRGTCYAVTDDGLKPTWQTGGWYAYHGDLLLSEDGNYLVRIAPTTNESARHSEDLPNMPCMVVYENGKVFATYKLSDLVGDLSKVVRGPEFFLRWQSEIALTGNTIEIKAIDGKESSIDLSKGNTPRHVKNWRRLKAGMTENEVIALLGKPLKMVDGPSSSGFTGPKMLLWQDMSFKGVLGQNYGLTEFYHVVFADDGTVKSWHRPGRAKNTRAEQDGTEKPATDGKPK